MNLKFNIHYEKTVNKAHALLYNPFIISNANIFK